ncbi:MULTISPECIES: hypothetical protein [unclassified Acinetobacter]|uniref:hypothetical protein n=1 Tax=unclassified Acinetobacter TaxID=196816 RepID=UPI0035BB8E87
MADYLQVHGDHWSSIYRDQKVLFEFLPHAITQADVFARGQAIYCDNTAESAEEKLSPITALSYAFTENTQYLFLMAHDAEKQNHQLVSFYPHLHNGLPIEVTLLEIHEWDNLLEATLLVEDEYQRQYCFFDTLYFMHKTRYKIGQRHAFSLSAMALHAQIVEETQLKLEGKQAEDFRRQYGDQDSSNEPLYINTANLVEFVANHPRLPQLASFQSPITYVAESEFHNIGFYQCDIFISEESRQQGLTLPLYVRQDMLAQRKPNIDQAIRGTLWLQGHCVEEI